MVEWIVSSSVLIAVVILLRFVLKGKISLRLQYALWAVVLVRLLVPVSFGDTAMSVGNLTQKAAASEPAQFVSALSETELPRMTYRAAYNEVVKEYADRGIQIEEMPLEEYAETVDYEIMNKMNGDLSIAEVVKIIWISGIVLVGVWFLLSNLRLYLSLKKTRTLLTDRHALLVYLSDAIDTPCLFGLFHPAIYLTSEAIESEHTQRHAVEHELTHFHHKDNIWAILRSVCLAVHWFNPLVWCAAVLSRNDAELACDESTILRLGEDERAAYGRTLIHLTCEKRPALLNTATTMTGSGKSIKERIALIVKKPKMAGYTLAAVILITVFAVGCTFTGASTPSEAPDESGTTSTGQYASMEDFAAAAMGKTTTVTYYTLYDPNTDPSSPREATATVQDTKIAWLEKKGEVSGLAPEGTLEAWTFNYLVKIDADPTTVSLVGGMYEEDGWFDLEGQGGHNIVALRYEDGSYDILYDAPVNDNYAFYGLRNSYEEAIYDWYVKKNNLDLPLYVKDWVDIITVPGGESLGDFPVHRYDGDGWYIYLPVQAWTTPFRNSAGNYEIYSQYDTGSYIIIGKNSANEEQTLAHYLDLGFEITEVGLVKRDGVETDCVYIYPADDGGSHVVHAIWYDENITDYPYIAMEPDVMRLIAESFTVDARIVGLAPENAAEELAMVQALRDATMDNSTLTQIEENKEVDLVRSGATMDVLKSAAENLQVLEDPLELDAHIGAAYLWLGDPGDRHISFRAAKEPYQVKIRYVGDDVNESAVTNNPQLYLFLMAAAEKENVELHDLDGDGLLEGIVWPFPMERRNIIIYDVFDGALQRIDVNEAMNCKASDFTGLIANIHPDYNKMVQIADDAGQVDVYAYHDGELSYVCPLSDVTGYAPPYATVALSAEEIAYFNELFAPIHFDRQGNPIGVNPWTCFFTSYYDDVRELDFEEFLCYFPGDGSTVDETEFAALMELDNFLFRGEVSSLSDMPVPVNKFPARLVDMVLKEYAGITTDDLDTSGVEYLAEYDAYYNYTSDFGPGTFTCTRGEEQGNIIRLYDEESPLATDVLTLQREGDNYRIVSHLKQES